MAMTLAAPETDAGDRLRELEEHASLLLATLGARELTREEYLKATERNDAELAEVRSLIVRDLEAEAHARKLMGVGDLEKRWDKLDVDEQRTFLRLLAEDIVVMPAVRGRNFYSPERLKVTWRV